MRMRSISRSFLGTMRLAGLLFAWIPLAGAARCEAPVYLWFEAEDFTTATAGVETVQSRTTRISLEEREGSETFRHRSGLGGDVHRRASNEAYIEMGVGERDLPAEKERVVYDLEVPAPADYHLWVRFDSPPPCGRFLNLWFDSEEAPRKSVYVSTSHWSIWSWWPWGSGQHLESAPHRLFLSGMSFGLRVDKFLLTTDPDYVPFGLNEHQYTKTFEPLRVAGYHGWSRGAPAATGWTARPEGCWRIAEEPLSGNHYYEPVVSRIDGVSSPSLALALIDGLEVGPFEATFRVIPEPGGSWGDSDAMFLFAHRDERNLRFLRLTGDEVVCGEIRDGSEVILGRSGWAPPGSGGGPLAVSVTRRRDGLEARVGEREVLNVRLPYPRSGAVGIATRTGDVGLDDVVVKPLDDPAVDFDFRSQDDPARHDWVLHRDDASAPWTSTAGIRRGDLLLYDVPPWSGAELSLTLRKDAATSFSILFPFESESRRVSTVVKPGPSWSLSASRRVGNDLSDHGSCRLRSQGSGGDLSLRIFSGLGRFAVFQDSQALLERNEYEILNGTVGFLFHGDADEFPVENLSIRRKELIIDGFPAQASHQPLSHWEPVSGVWRVVPVLEGEGAVAGADGQLVATERGLILLGQETWRTLQMKVSVRLTEETDAALVCAHTSEQHLRVRLCRGEVMLEKVFRENPVVLATAPLQGPDEGWRQVEVEVGADSVVVRVDGSPILASTTRVWPGRVGLWSEGDATVLDDFQVRVLSHENIDEAPLAATDQSFLSIEESVLE